jgi:hypothetical protein
MCVVPFKNLFLDFPGVERVAREEVKRSGKTGDYSLHEGVDC